jgi:hypothetical protein
MIDGLFAKSRIRLNALAKGLSELPAADPRVLKMIEELAESANPADEQALRRIIETLPPSRDLFNLGVKTGVVPLFERSRRHMFEVNGYDFSTDPQLVAKRYEEALEDAILFRNPEIVMLLMAEAPPTAINRAFLASADANDIASAKLLMQSEKIDHETLTVGLHYAVEYRAYGVVELLLADGHAEPYIPGDLGSVLSKAISSFDGAMVEMLLTSPAVTDSPRFAAQLPEGIRWMLLYNAETFGSGADAHGKYDSGNLGLEAVRIVKAMLATGKIDQSSAIAAMDFAVMNRQHEIIRYMVNEGSLQITADDPPKWINFAINNNVPDLVKTLINEPKIWRLMTITDRIVAFCEQHSLTLPSQ